MNKEKLENNLKEVISLYNNLQWSLHDLLKWVNSPWNERMHLDDFLDFLWLEKTEESRYAAYTRVSNLQENSLELYLEKKWFTDEEIKNKLDLSYWFVCEFHSEIQAVLIAVIESKKLLTPFYLEIFKWVANVSQVFLNSKKK